MQEGFAPKDDALVTKLTSHVAFLYGHGDDQVRNCLRMSFVEGLAAPLHKGRQPG